MSSLRSLDVFDVNSGYRSTLHESTVTGSFDDPLSFGAARPFVSPDGSLILVDQQVGDGGTRAWTFSSNDGHPKQLTFDFGEPFSVQVVGFTVDGHILAESCTDCVGAGPTPHGYQPHRSTDILLLTTNGTIDSLLVHFDEVVTQPALSADGATLLYVAECVSGLSSGSDDLCVRGLDIASGEGWAIAPGSRPAYPQPMAAHLPPLVTVRSPAHASWTVIVASAMDRSGAAAAAARLASLGLPAEVFASSNYSSLRPGYWVTASGRFSSEADAAQAATGLRDQGFDGAYPRELVQ
jgi:hypothetical protein